MLAEAAGGDPAVIIIGTGSEVQIALAARDTAAGRRHRRPGLFPCRAWNGLPGRTLSYQEEVLPPRVRARVSVEAGIALGWRAFAGDAGRVRQPGAFRRIRRLPESVRGVRVHRGARGRGRPGQPGPAERDARDEGKERGVMTASSSTTRRHPQPADRARAWRSGSTTSAGTGCAPATWPTWCRDRHVRGVTSNPTIFAHAVSQRLTPTTSSSPTWPCAGSASTRRPGRSPPTTSAGAATCCARSTTRPTAWTAGCPSRWTRGSPGTPPRPSPRPGRCGGWWTGPTCSSRSRPPRRACPRSPSAWPRGSAST